MPAVIDALKNLTVTDEEFKAAKKALKVDIAEQSLNPTAVVEAMGAHALIVGDSETTSTDTLIEMVSLADVNVGIHFKISNLMILI